MLKLHIDLEVTSKEEAQAILDKVVDTLRQKTTATEIGARLLDDSIGSKFNEFIEPNPNGHKTTKKTIISLCL